MRKLFNAMLIIIMCFFLINSELAFYFFKKVVLSDSRDGSKLGSEFFLPMQAIGAHTPIKQ